MSTSRVSGVATRALVACSRRAVPRIPFIARPAALTSPPPAGTIHPSSPCLSVRWHSSSGSKAKVYDFEAIQSLSSSPSTGRILIDVREPAEYEAGYIPTAINIPVSSQPDAMFLPEAEFEDRFGFAKPALDHEVVFYCKAGVRSSAAAQLAQQHGYQNVAEYRGSWLDWTKQGGKTAK